MAVTAVLALLFVGLALFFQSPPALARFGLANRDMYQRARSLTGLGFACILLAFGFFLAGVPVNMNDNVDGNETAVADNGNPTPTNEPTASQTPLPPLTPSPEDETEAQTSPTPRPTSLTPQSGAFGGPPPNSEEPSATPEPNVTPSPTSQPTNTLTPNPTSTASATPTPSPTPTQTPTPTLTPTPIEGETATVELGGNTLWVRRSPGGQEFTLLQDGDVVIVESGKANQSGLLWQEITTVNGLTGWVQAEFLIFADS